MKCSFLLPSQIKTGVVLLLSFTFIINLVHHNRMFSDEN